MSQTMLLTRRLTTFLNAFSSPQLHTLLLLSPTGKLLSSASPLPASVLRIQATVAVSLWAQYSPNAPSPTSPRHKTAQKPAAGDEGMAITIQLERGIMCIRALSSGLLFVAIGPSSASHQSSQYLAVGSESHSLAPSSPGLQESHGSQMSLHEAGSEAGSVAGDGKVSIWGVRRKAEAVAKALEGRLNGFVLSDGGVI